MTWDEESVLAKGAVIIYFNTVQHPSTKWYCHFEQFRLDLNESNKPFEIENDPAYEKDMLVVTSDWIQNDKEILLELPNGRILFSEIGNYGGGIFYIDPDPTVSEDELITLSNYPKH